MDGTVIVAARDTASWYVLQVYPGAEYRVRRMLDRRATKTPRPNDHAGKRFLARGEIDPVVAAGYRRQRHLDRAGYDLWLPECLVVTKLRRVVIRKKGPWFPGYLFVRLDLARQGWREFEDVDGAAGLLLDHGVPRAVPDDRIAGLRALCDAKSGLAVIEPAPRPQFKKGQRLRITDGPFATFEALFDERVADRIKAVLDLFGRSTVVELDEAQVEPAS